MPRAVDVSCDWTLGATVSDFDEPAFHGHLSDALAVPPHNIALNVTAASLNVAALVYVPEWASAATIAKLLFDEVLLSTLYQRVGTKLEAHSQPTYGRVTVPAVPYPPPPTPPPPYPPPP